MSKPNTKAAVYVVERAAYKAWDFGETPNYIASDGEEGGSFVPVRAFADRAAAEAYRAEREAEVRSVFSPALFFGFELPCGEDALAARLRGMGFEPPRFREPRYSHTDQFRQWWGEHAADMTPEQKAAFWNLLPDVAFYRVTETTLED